MANKIRNFLASFFGVKARKLSQKKEQEIAELQREIKSLKSQLNFLLGDLYSVEEYKLGPGLPQEGKLEREYPLSSLKTSLQAKVLTRGAFSETAGVNPVAWGGTRWVLKRKF